MEEQKKEEKKPNSSVEQDKGITYLSYIGILFLVPMLTKKDSKFAQFHAKQGLVLTVCWFLVTFLFSMMHIGYFGFFGSLESLLNLAVLILSIIGLINVSKGEMKELPVIGSIAKSLNI